MFSQKLDRTREKIIKFIHDDDDDGFQLFQSNLFFNDPECKIPKFNPLSSFC